MSIHRQNYIKPQWYPLNNFRGGYPVENNAFKKWTPLWRRFALRVSRALHSSLCRSQFNSTWLAPVHRYWFNFLPKFLNFGNATGILLKWIITVLHHQTNECSCLVLHNKAFTSSVAFRLCFCGTNWDGSTRKIVMLYPKSGTEHSQWPVKHVWRMVMECVRPAAILFWGRQSPVLRFPTDVCIIDSELIPMDEAFRSPWWGSLFSSLKFFDHHIGRIP
jgi:hypothetical protein